MGDRRLTPANARAAHESLRGVAVAPRYTPGERMQLRAPLADLLAAPGGARDRQLVLGDVFTVIDRDQGFAFGQAEKDGYCGYLSEAALAPWQPATHWLAAPASHLYPEPKVQAHELAPLYLGARLTVTGQDGKFARTTMGFVPSGHLRPLGDWFTDPAKVAMLFLGTPYLWGGNSRAGIDCSGLVQAALLSCGLACPGDSDLQQAIGREAEGDLCRGDLLFWRGHVAMVVDKARLIHANGHYMSTVLEPIPTAIDRIRAQGGGEVTAQRRI